MKIGFFITARLKSTRLKNKILLDLNGKSVIDRVIERAKKVQGIDGVVLCTSTDPQDSILYKNALLNNIEFYAGHPDDVLKRLLDAAHYFHYDAFISITADNPLFSIYTSEVLVDLYKKYQFDFVNTTGLPIGCGTYLLDVKTLEVATHIKQQTDTEIWGPFLNNSDLFNVAELIITSNILSPNIRLTLDYWEDYLLLSKLYNLNSDKEIPTITDVAETIGKHIEILKINSKWKQRNLSSEILQSIKNNISARSEDAKKFAKTINKKIAPAYTKITIPFDE